jgi:hypothetical protein
MLLIGRGVPPSRFLKLIHHIRLIPPRRDSPYLLQLVDQALQFLFDRPRQQFTDPVLL